MFLKNLIKNLNCNKSRKYIYTQYNSLKVLTYDPKKSYNNT